MATAQDGDTVKVHYTGKLADGTLFDSSEGNPPLEFTIGSGQIIQGFEEAVVGMETGETRTTTVPPEKAYGPHKEEFTVVVKRTEFPASVDPELGQQLQMTTPSGETTLITVTDVNESEVTLDANHPLAGQDLLFEIELVEIS